MEKGRIMSTVRVRDLNTMRDSMMVYKGDIVNVHRKENKFYLIECPITGNTLKVPARHIVLFQSAFNKQ